MIGGGDFVRIFVVVGADVCSEKNCSTNSFRFFLKLWWIVVWMWRQTMAVVPSQLVNLRPRTILRHLVNCTGAKTEW